MPLNALLGRVAWLAGWPSTTSTDALRKPSHNFTTTNITLNHAAVLAGWPTPTAALADKGVRSTEGGIREAMRSRSPDLAAMACLSSWPTPQASDSTGGGQVKRAMGETRHGSNLNDFVLLVATNRPARLTVSGELLTGCSAGMKSGGQLNPAHSRWLMGLPVAWDECAPIKNASPRFSHAKTKAADKADSGDTETRSTPKRRRSSSSPRAST
ncbi:macromolecule metabolism; macromolecule synthesis, modification; dna-replication, repair, restr./modif [Burkholderia singularis]|uniref:Macromolecule metabolism macromolecule synthesis, modification dna-replication, repair, restr./modif n=1 Tax=Burkholderia singularis TaxID=1503053 RepID=A0A238H5J0_9BURK|nr:macromolecule metabolism; macromolecule synthesis, modification; dna-replication, repair, restr./modif [Burkholderia singularis]